MRYAAMLLLAGLFAPLLTAIPPAQPVPFVKVEEMSGGLPVAQLADNDTPDYGRVFPPTQVGQTSAWLTIRITSEQGLFGGAVLNMTAPAINAGGSNFELDTTGFNTSGVQIGDDTEFKLRFTPQSAGNFSGTVTFTYEAEPYTNPGVYTDFRINCSGDTVTGPVAYLAVYETAAATTRVYPDQPASNARLFGKRKLDAGETGYIQILIHNDSASGGGNIALGMPTLTGASGEFTLDLSNFQQNIAAGTFTELYVAFDPSSVGVHDASIEFTHNEGIHPSPFKINLRGEGVSDAAQIRVSDQPGPFFDTTGLPPQYTGTHLDENAPAAGNRDFGTVDGGNTGTLTITVANADVGYLDPWGYKAGADLALAAPTVTGDADFILDLSSFGTTVSSAATTTFVIRFDPQANGVRTATIEIPHLDGSERTPFRINVTGIGANIGSGGGGSGGGSDDGGGCAAGTTGNQLWLLAIALGGVLVATRLRRRSV